MGQYRSSFLRRYNLAFFITCIIQHWWDTRMKGEFTTAWEENTTDCTWRVTCTRLLDILRVSPKPSANKRWRTLQLFLASGLPDFVERAILGPLPKRLNGSQYVLIIKDLYLQIRKDVPTPKMTASHIETLFMDNWITPYDISMPALTDNRMRLSIGFWSRFAPSWEWNIWRTWRIIRKRTERQNDLTR